jgi:hypothetical protein
VEGLLLTAFQPVWVSAMVYPSGEVAKQIGDSISMPLSPEHVECLLIAILSVNKYPPEKTLTHLPALRAQGLTDPVRVVRIDIPETIEALVTSG